MQSTKSRAFGARRAAAGGYLTFLGLVLASCTTEPADVGAGPEVPSTGGTNGTGEGTVGASAGVTSGSGTGGTDSGGGAASNGSSSSSVSTTGSGGNVTSSATTIGAAGEGGSAGCDCAQQQNGFVHQPLECACDPESNECPSTFDEALAAMCSPNVGQTVVATRGCGKIRLEEPNGIAGSSLTFDAKSGSLIGVYEYSDIAAGACNAWAYISGDVLFVGTNLPVGESCQEGDLCMACGTGAYPPCDF